jgi:hypothetical protein
MLISTRYNCNALKLYLLLSMTMIPLIVAFHNTNSNRIGHHSYLLLARSLLKHRTSSIQKQTIESPTHSSNFYSSKQFRELGCSDAVQNSLLKMGIQTPSKIQALSFTSILSGSHCVLADQTGM